MLKEWVGGRGGGLVGDGIRGCNSLDISDRGCSLYGDESLGDMFEARGDPISAIEISVMYKRRAR